LGSALRWILPTATLLPIALLSKHSWDPYSDEWYAWNGLLVVGAIGFAIWSIKHQWKPFLVSGLGYLATSVFILFFGLHYASKDVFETHVDQTNWFNSMAITSTVVIAFLAIAALFISWFFPSTIKD
jgi:hypothetical protein